VPAGHDDLVAELPRHAKPAALHPPVHHHGSADAGAKGDADQPVLPLPGAKAPFRPGRSVGVVNQHDGAPQQVLQVVPQRLVPPGEVRAEQHRAAVEIHPPGGANAHRPDPGTGAQFLDEFDDDALHRTRIASRRGPARLAQDVALGVHHAGGNLGAANVDADGKSPPAQPQLLPEQAVASQLAPVPRRRAP
jgi:hypothetical protein